MRLTRLSAIAGNTILPIADARAALNILDDDHDARIIRARDGAIDFAERYTGLAFLESSFLWEVDGFASTIALPRGPVVSVDAITYLDSEYVEQALEAADWLLARDRVRAAYSTTWPTGEDVQIEFTAGHAAVGDVPPMLMAGMVVAMAALFADAETPDMKPAQRCLDQFTEVIG